VYVSLGEAQKGTGTLTKRGRPILRIGLERFREFGKTAGQSSRFREKRGGQRGEVEGRAGGEVSVRVEGILLTQGVSPFFVFGRGK